MGCSNAIPSISVKNVLWFDENINDEDNFEYLEKMKKKFVSVKGYTNIEEGFKNYYVNDFSLIVTIVSGRLWGRYLSFFKKKINQILNIPYTIIFTSEDYKSILYKIKSDKEHNMSYDTLVDIGDPFYNPGGVVSCIEDLIAKIESLEISYKFQAKTRLINKYQYEGLLTFEYLENEEDLIAPALYKDIITNEPLEREEIIKIMDYLITFNNDDLRELIVQLKYFDRIPIEILSKYMIRCYTFESDFYRTINFDLMHSKMENIYKSFIKLLYFGIEKKSFFSFTGKKLYRGAMINKKEYENIKQYKKEGKINNIVVFSKAFLSFSKKKDEAKKFIDKPYGDVLGVLYVLDNNNKDSMESNACIQQLSAFPDEEEILFFPGSSFIISDIKAIDDSQIEIDLNYNGKFKEVYNVIYSDNIRVNKLIENNCITKLIAGKELEFLYNGNFLIMDNNINMHGENSLIKKVMKAKNLKNNEIVLIKELKGEDSFDEKYFNQLTYLLKESNRISKYACSLKDTFQIKDKLYMVVGEYDDNLSNYLKNIRPKGIPPNLIKKIISQLIITLKGLEDEIGERFLNPRNILIKYTNEVKTNFDVFLSENGIYEFENDFYSFFFYPPSVISKKIKYGREFIKTDNNIKIKNELYSIGMTLYELYANKLVNEDDSDYQLCKSIFEFNGDFFAISELNETRRWIECHGDDYEFIKEINKKFSFASFKLLPLFEELAKSECHNRELIYAKIKENVEQINTSLNLNINSDIYSEYGLLYERIKACENGLIDFLHEKRKIWITELEKEIEDKSLIDLIKELTSGKSQIRNYDDLKNHKFFSNYIY